MNLAILVSDRRFRDDGARKAMLTAFDLLGDDNSLTKDYYLMDCFKHKSGYRYLFQGFMYMKLRWLILFFLFGVGGVVFLQLAADYNLGLITTSPSPQPTVGIEDSAISRALNKLPKGEVYQNVPEKMQVGVPEIIEAGIAPQVTEKIRKELQGKGDSSTQSGVRYAPAGVEMKLVVQPDEFKVFAVKGGNQFVTASTPGKWLWRVTPLKEGDNLVLVKAIIDLNVPELKITRPVEVEVFSATRKVRANWNYSSGQFLSANWKEILGVVVGSGSLASLTTWLIGRKDKKKAEMASKG